MPYKKIYSGDDGIILEAFGILTDNDLDELSIDWTNDVEKSEKLSYVFLDTSKVVEVHISNAQIKRNAERAKKALRINPKMHLALYSNSDLVFGIGRMWQVYACEIPDTEGRCNVSRDRNEVIKWIKSEIEKT